MSLDRDTLCAVLLNPPLTSGSRTRRALNRAGALLGGYDVTIVNLVNVATHSSSALATAGHSSDWQAARVKLASALRASDELLFGWGLTPHLGAARKAAEEQIAWLLEEAHRVGHQHAWAVGNARHPSRWHQYTADVHGRTGGGQADERLREVLTRQRLVHFRPAALRSTISPARARVIDPR